MFTFSNVTSKSQSPPSLRFRTFNGWTGTIERVRAIGAPSPPAKPRKGISWLHRRSNNHPMQSVEQPMTPFMQSISIPLPLNYAPLPLVVGPMSSRPAETTLPVYGKDHAGLCTKVVLVASNDPLRPYRIRRINTRKELPWTPVSKPLPPLPSPPDSPSSVAYSPSIYSHSATPRNSLHTFDDGLDDLSIFLRRISYDVISATTIHRHLGYMEDGGRVISLGRTTGPVRRGINPPKRYSSLVGVSFAIMEGRLPKALVAM